MTESVPGPKVALKSMSLVSLILPKIATLIAE